MFRRVVLLTIICLAACAGDQPTEPSWGGEFASLLAAPPPPPAPPTTLTGELGGGTGIGVSSELGYWESAVYATVTVDGTLGFSGRPDGYLPGTGQIDAAGILVQNQCDLTVYVGFATGTVAQSTTVSPTCYYPARNIGSYSRRMTLQGRVYTYRTAGPPLSCYKGITPCVSYAGTQNVTVTPEEGSIVLTANQTVVAPGGGITINAKGVWSTDGVTGVPFTVREWRWQGSGSELGGGHTKVCAVYNPNQCIVQVYQSGSVVLEALVNGVVKTEKVWIAVVGGDTLPPPVDTIPADTIPTDTIPTDTIPGGGGGCGSTAPSGPQLACEPDPDSLIVQVTLSRSTMLPLLTRRYFDAVNQTHFTKSSSGTRTDVDGARPDTVTVRIAVRRKQTGEPAQNISVRVTGVPVEGSGGHIHTTGVPRPTGTFYLRTENTQTKYGGSHRGERALVTGEDGTVEVIYRSSGLGGLEWIIGQIESAEPASTPRDSARLELRVPGLVELEVSGQDLYRFKPQVPSVPSMRHGNNNRWLQSSFRTALIGVFNWYYSSGGLINDPESGGSFYITDIGLAYGGLNDVGSTSEWQSPHMTHRTGLDMDIRSVRTDGGVPVSVFTEFDKSLLFEACYGTEDMPGQRVKRCSFEPPPEGNYPHLHIEGWP